MTIHSTACIDHSAIEQQRRWSNHTFGPGPRTKGVLEHLRRELVEVEAAPSDAAEWADLLILVIDGATRQGIAPQALIDAYHEKMAVNRGRIWPDWRTRFEDEPIEHIRGGQVDPLCSVCDLDNRNGTHDALERFGHLRHPFTPADGAR